MPVITIDADLKWAVPVLEGVPLEPNSSYTVEQSITYSLGVELRLRLPDAMEKVGVSIDETEVVVTFTPPHHGINLQDIWITISPMQREGSLENTAVLLDSVRDAVVAILKESPLTKVVMPMVDIDIDYNHGAGLTLDDSQEEIARW